MVIRSFGQFIRIEVIWKNRANKVRWNNQESNTSINNEVKSENCWSWWRKCKTLTALTILSGSRFNWRNVHKCEAAFRIWKFIRPISVESSDNLFEIKQDLKVEIFWSVYASSSVCLAFCPPWALKKMTLIGWGTQIESSLSSYSAFITLVWYW